nr:MAG TPA: hypothetical protein [Caudoviricetes sp.]
MTFFRLYSKISLLNKFRIYNLYYCEFRIFPNHNFII